MRAVSLRAGSLLRLKDAAAFSKNCFCQAYRTVGCRWYSSHRSEIRYPFDQVTFEDGYFLLGCVIVTLFSHGLSSSFEIVYLKSAKSPVHAEPKQK